MKNMKRKIFATLAAIAAITAFGLIGSRVSAADLPPDPDMEMSAASGQRDYHIALDNAGEPHFDADGDHYGRKPPKDHKHVKKDHKEKHHDDEHFEKKHHEKHDRDDRHFEHKHHEKHDRDDEHFEKKHHHGDHEHHEHHDHSERPDHD